MNTLSKNSPRTRTSSTTPSTRTKKKPIKPLYKGIVYIEFLKLQIPVFSQDSDRVAFLKAHNNYATDAAPNYLALVSLTENQEGIPIISATIPPTTSLSTLVHEASHIVDFAFDITGIDTDIASTETRGYMIQHVWEQLYKILAQMNKRSKQSISVLG
jgi:hypothetical protein